MSSLPEITFGIAIVFSAVYAGFLLVLMICWAAIKEEDPLSSASAFITVVIVARNEQDTIIHCLQSLANQDYPNNFFEIIVADDFSEDKTGERIRDFIQVNPSLQITLIQGEGSAFASAKKQYIGRAVTMARGELIATTDADCIVPEKWLSTLSRFYEKWKAPMIIGPVSFSPGQSFLEKFQALEFCGILLATGATAFMHKPVLCNGANLAFTKDAFLQVKGYAGNEHIASGDDIFLMNKIKARFPGKIKFMKSRSAIVSTRALRSFPTFIQQRTRWVSKASHHSNRLSNAMGLLTFLACFLPLFFLISSLVNPVFIYHFMLLVVIKYIFDFLYLYLGCQFSSKRNLLWIFPFALLFQILYVNSMMINYLFTSTYLWKGREFKK